MMGCMSGGVCDGSHNAGCLREGSLRSRGVGVRWYLTIEAICYTLAPAAKSPHSVKISLTAIMLLALVSRPMGQTGSPWPTKVGGGKPSPAFADVIGQLDAQQWKKTSVAESADVDVVLRSAETFQWNWLWDRKGQLQGLDTIRNGDEDILLERWAPRGNDRDIRSIQMWDGPLYELVIFEIDPSLANSAESLRIFLRTILKPPPEKLRIAGPQPEELQDGFGLYRGEANGELWRGAIFRIPINQVSGADEHYFTVQEISGRAFLMFDFGKRAAYAPWPQSIYLNERFPPLATRVQGWHKEKLLAEITAPERMPKCWDPRLMGQHQDYFRLQRDQVLIAEMVRRGLTPDDFQAVMDCPYGRQLLVRQLSAAGETERYTDLIVQTIHRFENLPDVNQDFSSTGKTIPMRSHLAEVIISLGWRGGPDFSKTMLELAAAGHEPELALNYMKERLFNTQIKFDDPHSQELADKLAAAKIPARSEITRDFIVNWIRSKRSN